MTVKQVLEALLQIPPPLTDQQFVGCFLQAQDELGLLLKPAPGADSEAYVRGPETAGAWERINVPPDDGL